MALTGSDTRAKLIDPAIHARLKEHPETQPMTSKEFR